MEQLTEESLVGRVEEAWVGAAASAQKLGTVFPALQENRGKLLRRHGVFGNSLGIDYGIAGIGLAEQGAFQRSAKSADQSGSHGIRTHAVKAYGSGSGFNCVEIGRAHV